ncbi:ABC transporter permease subunit [Gordonia jinhuaensis]|uniref:ABC transporter permease n=1 Tax=Gordonia jinhuaensis TaxID=1517702 RepID=A0A916TBG9_9ACTN|nr:ABC transporter permease subunit [Gordonia jinhuaensis]GGB38860.1 ABC transporter permease [Gordonia jinhuaensis]
MKWQWIADNWDQISDYGWAHLWLAVVPVIVGTVLSIPLGWIANRYRFTRGTLLVLGGVLYAIPSLPLFVVLPSILGTKILDPVNVEVALSIYALAIMLRSAADAFASVDRNDILSADAVGYGALRRFVTVELPLAGPVLLAGVRVVSVSTVSLVTVGSLIGVNSLGYFFIDGYQRDFPTEIWVGVIGTVLIALVLDAILVIIGRVTMPWAKRSPRVRARREAVAREAINT